MASVLTADAARGSVLAEEKFIPAIAPMLSGGQVIWGAWDHGRIRLRSTSISGGPVRTLQTLPGKGERWNRESGGGQVALEHVDTGEGFIADYTGRADGPFARTGTPCEFFLPVHERSVSTDGTWLAGYLNGCQAEVRNLTDPSAPSVLLPIDAHMPRVAWPYVAYLRGSRGGDSVEQIPLEMLDLRTGEVVLRLAGSTMP